MRPVIVAGSVWFAVASAVVAGPVVRPLTFEDRVAAQEAIERVYYAHQIGATAPFATAVPRSVLEAKVRTYLEESAALQAYWKTEVTDEMLERELERIAGGTRMPERLLELYAALGNDPFLIKECLARPTLVSRLARGFYAFDPSYHEEARRSAEELRRRVASGELSAAAGHPPRSVSRVVLKDGAARERSEPDPFVEEMGGDDFKARRAELPARAGFPDAIKETAEGYSFSVLLGETPGELRVANYTVAKTSFDDWWSGASPSLRGRPVAAVASASGVVPQPSVPRPARPIERCPDDDTWTQWTMREVPSPRRGHTAVWTGNVVVIWGGFGERFWTNSGSRYDPATDTWLSTASAGAPSARQLHRAVWTGTSMVVWGGRGVSNVYLGDGGRYDPITNTWLPISATNAPAARGNFTAVWTGTSVVVWGGQNDAGLTALGGRYDPSTDTWAQVSTSGAPAARSSHTAVWTGTRMVVWGGSGANVGTTGGRYDPVGDTWEPTATANAPAARQGHAAVWTGSVMVVWGGSGSNVGSTGGRYDPIVDAWTPTSTAGAPVFYSGRLAAWTGTEMIVWGGSFFDATSQTFVYPVDGGRYDPFGDTWSALGAEGVPEGRSGHTLTWTGGSIVMWGGARSETTEFVTRYLDTGARYDPGTGRWTPTSSTGTPRARYEHTAIWTGNVMVIWGGTDANTDFGTGGRYDPVLDDWSAVSTVNAPVGRYLHTAVWTGLNMLVWGGAARIAAPGYALGTGGAYDPIADAWGSIPTTGAPSKRYDHVAVWTGKEMLVWGGTSASAFDLGGGRYDPQARTWRSVAAEKAPAGRRHAAAVWTGRQMVVWGGEGAGYRYLDTGGRYDPSKDRWAPTSLVGAPAGRTLFNFVWTGRQLMVWGGSIRNPDGSGSVTDTGARYDPGADTWAPITTIGAPAPRTDHAGIWNGREMVVWGGYGAGYLGTGGRYDPVTDRWTPVANDGAPPPRTSPSAVWDGREMLVWGGYENASPFILVNTGGSYRTTPGESCNAIDDDCDGVIDEGAGALCDDGNPCTQDQCQGAEGCVYLAMGGTCDDGDPCTAADACDGDVCTGTPLTGAPCDDGNACTTDDACAAGLCTAGPARVCDDGDACTDDACDPASGCLVVGPHVCDDGSDCTVDSCDPATGCVFTPRTGACDDHSPCTTDETCVAGRCVPPRPACDDGDPCTDGVCESWGCRQVSNTAPCDDGYPCTVNDTCRDRTCTGTPTYGGSCDDHNACTTGDVCQGWSCNGAYRDCSDDNPCTNDVCDPWTGECGHPVAADGSYCTDDDLCTLGEACHGAVCSGSTPVDCFACPPGTEQVGSLCRWTAGLKAYYLFNQSGTCDNDAVNRFNGCDGGSYGIVYIDPGINLIPVSVDLQFVSGMSCTPGITRVTLNGAGVGEFTPTGGCQCYPTVQLVSFPDIDPSAYVAGGLNRFSFAPAGAGCEGLSRWMESGQYFGRITVTYAPHDRFCETATCAPDTGECSFSASPDGTPCGDACLEGAACLGGACQGEPRACDDQNPCTTDGCDPASGCTFAPNTLACDDGDACTTDDVCAGGSCRGTPGSPPSTLGWVASWKSEGATSFAWDTVPDATRYDVLRGRIGSWPVGSEPSTETCLADDLNGTEVRDAETPDPGGGFWYLARGTNVCGNGSYGWQESAGAPVTPRVSEACP